MALPLGWTKLRKFGLPTLHLCPACSVTTDRRDDLRDELREGLRVVALADVLL